MISRSSIKDIFRRCGDGSIADVQSGTEHDVLFSESEQTSDGVKTEEQKIEK